MFCRFLFWSTIGLYLISFFIPVHKYLANEPKQIYEHFQVWRLVTSPFMSVQLFMVLFGLLSNLPRGCQIERMKGTTNFLYYFMVLSFVSMVIMTLLDFVITFPLKNWKSMSLGLWTMVMVDMTVDSLKDPELERNL